MTVKLVSIFLYSFDGRVRTLPLKPTGLSIVTGESKTGKSALAHIIDYCWGSDDCHVPEGVIRRKVSWYGVLLDRQGDQLFIARKNPDQGRHSSTAIHVRSGKAVVIPAATDLAQNADTEGLKRLLSRYVGIEENLHIPPEDRSRDPLTANFSHARIYCFQDQSLIDNKNQLFFNQNDSFVAQAIRDTLPYFLGVVSKTELQNQRELARLSRELRILERQQETQVTWQASALDRAGSLLAEARQVGLLEYSARPNNMSDAFTLLADVLRKPSSPGEQDSFGGAELLELQQQQDSLRNALVDARDRLDEARVLGSSKDAYELELAEQKARLGAIILVPNTPSGDTVLCPLCEQPVDNPSHILAELRQELDDVGRRVSVLRGQNPRLQGYIAELAAQQADIETRLRDNQAQINAVIEQNEVLRKERELSVRRSRVQGRISSFLDSGNDVDSTGLERQVALLSAQINRLRADLTGSNFEDRLSTAMFVLTELMTSYAKQLDLEHSEGRTRLDIARLTVVSDTSHGSIRLENMGSGDNWVGCHVLTHFALHRYFRDRLRPVPAFLLLDQPSKAHYPPSESQLADREIKDDDRAAVLRLFKFIHDRAREDGFQVLVVDHADETEPWFREAIIERWRGGLKLVPDSWPEGSAAVAV